MKTGKILGILFALLLMAGLLSVTAAAEDIPSVSILSLDSPVIGASPDYSAALPRNANYVIYTRITGASYQNGISWSDVTEGTGLLPRNNPAFKDGHQYKVTVYLSAKTDYAFTNSTTAQVNAKPAEATMDGSQLKVEYTFPTLDIAINETNFPDANFRTYVSANCDTDGSGTLSTSELAAVTSIDVYNKSISSLKGVEYFTSLTLLNCEKTR